MFFLVHLVLPLWVTVPIHLLLLKSFCCWRKWTNVTNFVAKSFFCYFALPLRTIRLLSQESRVIWSSTQIWSQSSLTSFRYSLRSADFFFLLTSLSFPSQWSEHCWLHAARQQPDESHTTGNKDSEGRGETRDSEGSSKKSVFRKEAVKKSIFLRIIPK